MRQKSLIAFTLTELIVVVTILAILGTLGTISFNGYSKDARNSTRISDMKIIQKALDLEIVTNGSIPLPDDGVNVSYSGGTAWTQGVFGENSVSSIKKIPIIPLDPLHGVAYTYSVLHDRKYYQISAALEGGSFFSSTSPILDSSYALSNDTYSSHNLGNFTSYDIVVKNGTNCHVITAPSIILSDMPTNGVLENNTPYNYSYTRSSHISSVYSGSIVHNNTAAGFQNIEVFSGCQLNTISELKLYNAKLSTAFQQLTNKSGYEQLIYDSKSPVFMLHSATLLQERGIDINDSVINELRYPSPDQTFSDTFSNNNGVEIVGEHISDSAGVWFNIPGGDSSSYTISGNTAIKNDASTSKIYPRPNPNIGSADYSMSLDIGDFNGGNISLYLRYIDNDNFYRVELSSNGYTIYRKLGGTELSASDITETITPGSRIVFGVEGDNVDLSIAGIPKGSIVLGSVDDRGNPAIFLENAGASIDNYTLNYK